jgi:hypothetical protein
MMSDREHEGAGHAWIGLRGRLGDTPSVRSADVPH